MFIISMATAGTVLTLNIFKRGENDAPVPQFLQRIFFDIAAKCFFINVNLNPYMDASFEKIYISLKAYYIDISVDKYSNLDVLNIELKRQASKKGLHF